MSKDAEVFEGHRPALLALAYRMLGDMGRAEDMVQEAWVRWQGRQVDVEEPKAFLLTTVTRLCLDEIGSARARHEEGRSDRLPEPVDLDESGIGRVELIDQISMAFLVLLQRLTPAERAVLLLHDVFDMRHAEIAAILGGAMRPVARFSAGPGSTWVPRSGCSRHRPRNTVGSSWPSWAPSRAASTSGCSSSSRRTLC